jgi:hypothetical protein
MLRARLAVKRSAASNTTSSVVFRLLRRASGARPQLALKVRVPALA